MPRALLVAALCANAGCSFLFVDGPPAQHRKMPYFECSSGKGWPIVDGVLGVGLAIDAAGTMSSQNSANRADAVMAGVEAAAFLASAAYGASKTSACREAKDELMLRLMKTQPPSGRPGWDGQGAAPDDPWAPPPGAAAPPAGAEP
jgi:hypothetical protein